MSADMQGIDTESHAAQLRAYADSWLKAFIDSALDALIFVTREVYLWHGLLRPVTPEEWREHIAFFHPEDAV